MPTKKTKKTTAKKKSTFNFWPILTIVLLLITGSVIAYDKSATVHNSVNNLIGIEDEKFPVIPQIRVEVLSDKTIETPAYDLEKQLGDIEAEFEIDLVISQVDISEDKGIKYIEDYKLNSVPVVLFEDSIEKTTFYEETSEYFQKEGNKNILVLVPFKYLTLPSAEGGHVKGSENPTITIIEYSSFSCPYCSQMMPIVYQILDEHPEAQLVYKQFNRGGIDPILGNAAECGAEQGKFWEFHDYIFENQKSLAEIDPSEFLNNAATQAGVDIAQFDKCVEEGKYNDKIKEHTEEAFKFGVNGTPSFFVNDKFIGGAVSYESLKQVVESL